MKVSSKYKPFFPTHATTHFGTFVFCQPRQATAQNTKEPKFSNRTPTPKHVISQYNASN
jgi:hypothetical protein